MSWPQICAASPDQSVGLLDVVKGNEAPFDVISARVISASASPRDVLRTLDAHRDVDRSARHLFTCPTVAGEKALALNRVLVTLSS
jgi:hypothetical protein